MRCYVDTIALENAVDEAAARRAKLNIACRMAEALSGRLVRQQTGAYYLEAGQVRGEVPLSADWPAASGPAGPDDGALHAAAHSWLCELADAVRARLVYDGDDEEWYLEWPNIRDD